MEPNEDDSIYSDIDSEDFVEDMRHFGVGQALPLDGEGIDEDAANYLRSVREEAAKIPYVCASTRRHKPTAPLCSEGLDNGDSSEPLPIVEWIYSVVEEFVSAREQVHLMVRVSLRNSSRQDRHNITALHGQARVLSCATPPPDQVIPAVSDRRAWQASMRNPSFLPYANTLAAMDNNLAANCLCQLIDEVTYPTGHSISDANMEPGATSTVTGSLELDPSIALWLYGLMVRLEQPVFPDVAAALRQLLTVAEAGLGRCRRDSNTAEDPIEKVCTVGTELSRGSEDENDSASQVNHEATVYSAQAQEIARLDTLRVLAGGFFGQDATLAPLVHEHLSNLQAA